MGGLGSAAASKAQLLSPETEPQLNLGGLPVETWLRWMDQCRRAIWQDSTDALSWDDCTSDVGSAAIQDLGVLTANGFTSDCPVRQAAEVESAAIWSSTFETRGIDKPNLIDRCCTAEETTTLGDDKRTAWEPSSDLMLKVLDTEEEAGIVHTEKGCASQQVSEFLKFQVTAKVEGC